MQKIIKCKSCKKDISNALDKKTVNDIDYQCYECYQQGFTYDLTKTTEDKPETEVDND